MNSDNFVKNLPDDFKQNITEIFAEEGRQWLAELPETIDKIARKWGLKMGKHFSDLSFNYVLPCVFADGTDAVLKIGFPKNKPSAAAEYKILKMFGGKKIVRPLGLDEEYCALFIERLLPGENLKIICQKDDRRSNETAIEIMRKLWREPPQSGEVTTLDKWLESFVEAGTFEFESRIFARGRDCYRKLLEKSKQKVLLHGDLHHENILSAQRAPYLAIDPKGLVGDIGYELSVFLNNPRTWIIEHGDAGNMLRQRLLQFSEAFEIEPAVLYQWSSALPVLAAFWSLQDNSSDWENWLDLAKIWEEVCL